MRISKQASCPGPSVRGDAGGAITGNESFVTVNDDSATIPNSRQLTAGAGIAITDGGAGNPVTIENTLTQFRETIWFPGEMFRPAQSPYNYPAENDDIYLPISGNAHRAVRFIAGQASQATVGIPASYQLPTFALAFAQADLYWITNGDNVANNVEWAVGSRFFANASDFDIQPGAFASAPDMSNGAYYMNIIGCSFSFEGTWAANSFMTTVVSRGVDSNPDDVWLIGLRLTIGALLS